LAPEKTEIYIDKTTILVDKPTEKIFKQLQEDKLMDWKIQLSELNYDKKEVDSVCAVVKAEWLTMGNLSTQFEQEFQNFIGHKNQGVFVSSATAGLHLILMALGLEPGDEVILPALTFVSDANVVLQLGAKPIFCDSVSIENFNASNHSIIEKVTDKTKAIIIVHFAGYPMDLEYFESLV
jgi:dTDP-4-amino-4,6-dideoxygalactose transaminase